jgi:hypothetical protein
MKIVAMILFALAIGVLFISSGDLTTASASHDAEFEKGAAYGKYIASAVLAGLGLFCYRKSARKA